MVNLNIKDGIDTVSSVNSFIPTGALIMKASAPSALSNYDTDEKCRNAGFIPCDGRTLNASTYTYYQSLFNVIGNIYGGTNNTDFKVPDLRTSRRYVYGQSTASSGIYTPSFSVNTTNTISHGHDVNGVSNETLLTNAVAGSHTHYVTYAFANAGASNHSHYADYTIGTFTTGQALGTTLTKADGTGTAAGAAHTHNSVAARTATNTADGGSNHAHNGGGNSASYEEPTHVHTLAAAYVSIPTTNIDIPYVNMLYFIKI